MTRLSVNLNKVALLRNQRDLPYPNLIDTARRVLEAGAHGITIHPRPDERHVKHADVPELSAFLAAFNCPFPSFMMNDEDIGGFELNIEGYPDEDFLTLVIQNACEQVTLVPDAPDQKTSDHGWNIPAHTDLLKDAVSRLKEAGRRVSIFINPDPSMAEHAVKIGADRIELYTGPFALDPSLLPQYAATAKEAAVCGIGINAGHDLSLDNLAKFIGAVPGCLEVSIGHAMTADALVMGWNGAAAAYLTAIRYGHKAAKGNS